MPASPDRVQNDSLLKCGHSQHRSCILCTAHRCWRGREGHTSCQKLQYAFQQAPSSPREVCPMCWRRPAARLRMSAEKVNAGYRQPDRCWKILDVKGRTCRVLTADKHRDWLNGMLDTRLFSNRASICLRILAIRHTVSAACFCKPLTISLQQTLWVLVD